MGDSSGDHVDASQSSESQAVLFSGEVHRKQRSWNPITLCLTFRKKKIITVEPVLFLYMFGLYLLLSVDEQYIFNRYGRDEFRNELNYSGPFNFCMSTTLLNAEVGRGAGDKVEEDTSYLDLYVGVAGQLPAIFAALLYGPLSDRIGRKPIMLIIALAGCCTGAVTLVIMYLDLSVYLIIPLAVVNALAGSFPGMLTAVYSYTADVSSKKWLTLRLGILEAMIFIGATISLALGGQWLLRTSCYFQGAIWMYLACNVANILYVIFWLPESMSKIQRKNRMKNQPSGFRSLARGVRIFVVKQYSRWRLWFALVSMFFFYITAVGATSINTLYLLHGPLKWNPGIIGIYQSISELMHGVSLLVLLPFLVVIGMPDPLIILLGIVFATAMFTSQGLVQTSTQMFIVGVVQGGEAISGAPLRSIMSKAVAVADQGSLFSIIAAVQVLASAVASVTFFFLYPWMLGNGWAAGTIYFPMAILSILQAPLILTLLIFHNKPGAVYTPELQDSGTGAKSTNLSTGDRESLLSHSSKREKVYDSLETKTTPPAGSHT